MPTRLKLKTSKRDGGLFFASPKTHLEFVHSGCAVLDCVLGGGWPVGRMANIVGDKSTGKTLLAIEAMVNFRKQYPEGKIAYCEAEAAFDDEYAKALGLDIDAVQRPEAATVEELFDDLRRFTEEVGPKGRGLYIVDSLDALSDKAEQERGIAEGTYGASKPKQLGQLFRRMIKPLEENNVLLLIISQVRDNIGVAFGERHTRSGGRALDFYASQILWLAHAGQVKKTINKVTRTIGIEVRAKCKKNKIGLPFRECGFKIMFGYGIDDIEACLDFLKSNGAITESEASSYKRRFAAAGPQEEQVLRQELVERVRKSWFDIELAFLPKRSKYNT